MMNTDTIAQLGPMAIALGTFLEGETVLLLAGAGLAMGLLDFWTVVFSALAGSLAGDQCFFWLGRLSGASWLNRRPRFGARVRRVMHMLKRHRLPMLCLYRFIYGLRGAVPFAFGVSGLCWRYFLCANLCTAALWSTLLTLLGLHAGRFLADPSILTRLPMLGAATVILVGLGLLLRRRTSRP